MKAAVSSRRAKESGNQVKQAKQGTDASKSGKGQDFETVLGKDPKVNESGKSDADVRGLTDKTVEKLGEGESLTQQVAELQKTCIGKVNGEKEKINVAEGRVDSIYLRIGRFTDEFINAAHALGESRKDDYLYKSLAKDKDCRVKKGALYNACTYYRLHQKMTEQFGKAPACSMTDYVKVRHDDLTLSEQHELLMKAEADPTIIAAKLSILVGEKLKAKGLGRKDPAPDADLITLCNRAFTALTKVKGLLKKGIVASEATVLLLGKTSRLAADCLKPAGHPDGSSISKDSDSHQEAT